MHRKRSGVDGRTDGRMDVVTTIKTKSEVKVTVTRKMVCDTPPSQDASTHQIWNSYLKQYKRYVPDMIILKTRSEVKGQ